MKSYEKEVAEASLDDEEKTLNELKAVYRKAQKDCKQKISELDAKIENQNLQSFVYQKKYQEMIDGQISDILDHLENGQYKTVDDYLVDCYENGYIGNMYSIQKQTGLTCLTPIDQEKVAKAIKVDTQLSERYYQEDPIRGRLAENTKLLKTRIRSNLSRGIASGKTWSETAVDIAKGMNNPFTIAYNDAIRIVRTEGHRVDQQGFLDASDEAVANGADVVHQWDSTLDERTREAHREADGQIREVGEKFLVGGEYLTAPSIGGSAWNVINCRCQLLTRARWMLDEDELQTLKDRASYYGLDKTKDFDEFKTKFLKVKNKRNPVVLQLSNFPDEFSSKKAEKKNTEELVKFINSQEEVGNEDVVKLFSKMSDMEWMSEEEVGFKISHASDHEVQATYSLLTGKYTDVKLVIPKLDGSISSIDTTLHEEMHFMDFMMGGVDESTGWFSCNNEALINAFDKSDASIGKGIQSIFDSFHTEYDRIVKELEDERTAKLALLDATHPYKQTTGKESFQYFSDYVKQRSKIWKEIEAERDTQCRSALGGGVPALEDIYDALSGGSYRDTGVVKYGHGSDYYRSTDNRIEETLANYSALSVAHPELLEKLKKDKPEVVKALENCVSEMLKEVGEK